MFKGGLMDGFGSVFFFFFNIIYNMKEKKRMIMDFMQKTK